MAITLAAVAVGSIAIEPFPEGFVLLVITPTHGIDAGDLPAIFLLVAAGWLAV